MIQFNLWTILFIALFTQSAFGFIIDVNPGKIKQFASCVPTKSTDIVSEPKEIISDNNLLNKVGNFSDNLVPKIILFGRVRDKDCIPIPNATVSLWQTDEQGVYRYIRVFDTEKDIYNMHNQVYSVFEGVGSTISTNTGEFAFITVHPGRGRGGVGKAVNVVIEHKQFPELRTMVVLADKSQLTKKSNHVIAVNTRILGSNGIKIYYFDVVLDGKVKNLNY